MTEIPKKLQLTEDMYTEQTDQAGQSPEEVIKLQLLEDIAQIAPNILDLEDERC